MDSTLLFVLPDLRAYGLTETDRERKLFARRQASCSSDLVPSSGPVMWKKSVRSTREGTSDLMGIGGRLAAREKSLEIFNYLE